MKIRSYLVFFLLIATLLPTLIFSIWSYRDAVSREFAEVEDRHLLLARETGFALDRYQRNLVTTFKTVTSSLVRGQSPNELAGLLTQFDMCCVFLADKTDGRVTGGIWTSGSGIVHQVPPDLFADLKKIARTDMPVYSDVMASKDNRTCVFLIRELENHYAIAEISSAYFKNLSQSIIFGEKGHAAIVDRSGTVIAHPRQEWVDTRKNISQIPIVARMMNGETGIAEFFSPAVDKEMIAGFTSVPGPGWGVMVAQPVSEIYEKVATNQSSLLLIIGGAVLATIAIGLLLARSLSRPLEDLARATHTSARHQKLTPVKPRSGLIRFREIADYCESYNTMVSRMTRAGEQIERLAYSDHVTGLPNRDHLQSVAEPILREAHDPDRGGIVALIDLDNFKEVNDLHGHHAGDLHLKACAQTLLEMADSLHLDSAVPDGTIAPPLVARIGGDEFIMLIQGLVSEPRIQAFLERVLAALAASSPELSIPASASIGCARFPEHGQRLEDLTKRADVAMYHAKRAGKNRMHVFSPEIDRQSAAEIRRDLISAIKDDRLFLEYQPKICTTRRKVVSVEALVRWNHPELGYLLPEYWIPMLGASNAMNRLGEWVVGQAMKDHAQILNEGHDLWMSVNIGSNHFVSPDFIDTLETIRSDVGFDSARLEIEVTEDALFTSEKRALSTFTRLHDLRYKVSIDDFGTGYSNITRLAGLPVDYLKLDHSLIAGASVDPRIRTILASTIDMAEKLGCKTVAEGIETQSQAEFATHLGANALQGRYFTGALPLRELMSWLDLQNSSSGHAYLKPESEAV
ncbi:EAL domain-containing protein [uncultured Roseibium sp.]|uniref:bifunctional diguanylate cyclase/phosphodiesterase n=1 Tax=uncultured Roseibium sp. TaxID=1936171 RepID=UPI002613F6B1|nr:EAL domain-containing protein [uncultured Roseibium sp.]